jgi:hypothetical protein
VLRSAVRDNSSESSSPNAHQRRQRVRAGDHDATLLSSSTKQGDDPVGAPIRTGGRAGSPGTARTTFRNAYKDTPRPHR